MVSKGKGTQTGTNGLGVFLLSDVARENSVSVLTNSFGEGIGSQKLLQMQFLILAPKTGVERWLVLLSVHKTEILSEIITNSWWWWQFLSLTFVCFQILRMHSGMLSKDAMLQVAEESACVVKDNRKQNYTCGCDACGSGKLPLYMAQLLLWLEDTLPLPEPLCDNMLIKFHVEYGLICFTFRPCILNLEIVLVFLSDVCFT